MRPPRAAAIAALLAVLAGMAWCLAVGSERTVGQAARVWSKAEPAIRSFVAEAELRITRSTTRSPALVAGVAAALALPLLALGVWLLRRLLRWTRNGDGTLGAADSRRLLVTSPMAKAWLQVEGQAGRHQLALSGELIRIGRTADNDLSLADRGVDDVHALIRRTPDAEFIIIDVSAGAGSGIAINGHRRAQARLRNGDRIDLGQSSLTFHRAMAQPAGSAAAATTMTH